MSNEELVKDIRDGIRPKENIGQLYKQNLGFIYKIAKKYAAYAEMDDLMQEGFLALVDAVDQYDPEREARFSTYLHFRLRAWFRHYVDNTCKVKRLPAYMQERIQKYRSYMSECAAAGREPEGPEVCRDLNITKDQLERMRKAMYEADCISIDDMIPGTESSFGELLADPVDLEAEVIEQIARDQLQDQLWKIVDELSDPQNEIIINRYRKSCSLRSVGEALGLSIEKVRYIEKKALDLLRRKREIRELAEEYGIYFASNESMAFRGGYGSFKNHETSIVEYIALKEIEHDEQIQQKRQKLKDIMEEIQSLVSRPDV